MEVAAISEDPTIDGLHRARKRDPNAVAPRRVRPIILGSCYVVRNGFEHGMQSDLLLFVAKIGVLLVD